MKKKELVYELEANGGEKIESFAKRLVDYYKEVNSNKLASYAEFVNGGKNVVVGEFNNIKIKIDSQKSTEEIVTEIKNKLKINIKL